MGQEQLERQCRTANGTSQRVYMSNRKKNEERRQQAERWSWRNEFEVKQNFVKILKWDGSARGREREGIMLIGESATERTIENDNKNDW